MCAARLRPQMGGGTSVPCSLPIDDSRELCRSQSRARRALLSRLSQQRNFTHTHLPTTDACKSIINMKLIAAAPLLLIVPLALSLPFHQLEARIESGATSQKLDPLERRGNVHHSNIGPPGPNGPSCEHPPCPGLTRDLNGYDAPDRREVTVGLAKRSSSPGIGPLERGDAGPHFGPGPVQPTCEHPRPADDRPARRSCTAQHNDIELLLERCRFRRAYLSAPTLPRPGPGPQHQ